MGAGTWWNREVDRPCFFGFAVPGDRFPKKKMVKSQDPEIWQVDVVFVQKRKPSHFWSNRLKGIQDRLFKVPGKRLQFAMEKHHVQWVNQL